MSINQMEGYIKGIKVHASHFGYQPEHKKHVICTDLSGGKYFHVINAMDYSVAYQGELRQVQDDFGQLLLGDFSDFSQEGEYYICVGNEKSFGTFKIKDNLWGDLQKYIAMYFFGARRMGEDNVIGNMGDFHGIRWNDARLPGGEGWRYIGSSFADGDDRRVYPSVSLVVAQYCELKRTGPFWDSGDWIYSQVRWGLDGALSFLDKDGILRKALYAFPDGDTTGEFYNGDEKMLGDAFDQTVTCNEYGLSNREVVYSTLLLGPAEAVYTYYDRDPEFFDRVRKLCEIGYEKIEKIFKPFQESGVTHEGYDFSPFIGKYSAAAWIWLSVLMHKITGQEIYKQKAIEHVDMLINLQQKEPLGNDCVSISGWYRKETCKSANPWGEKPEQEVMITPFVYQCLFKLMEFYPEHEKASKWKASIKAYASDYLLEASKLNSFGFTPMKVGTKGLKRQKGTLSYQYFASIGRMFHQIGNAAYLIQAGKILADSELIDAGWKQIQWYAGFNPLGLGCIYGLSNNIPSAQYNSETYGRCIYGGTKNGMTGDEKDFPEVRFWEYYTYGSINCLWFATTIGSKGFSNELELWPRETREAPHEPVDLGHRLCTFPIRVKGGFSYRFAAIQNVAEPVRFYVSGIVGGYKEAGFITPEGVYSAPYVSELKKVRIKVERVNNKDVWDETEVTVMPAPTCVKNVKCIRKDKSVFISWDCLEENCTGYTIWRRLPAAETEVGTIFERIWAVRRGINEYEYMFNSPTGTEFMVRAYYRSQNMIYGYGRPSNIVVLK